MSAFKEAWDALKSKRGLTTVALVVGAFLLLTLLVGLCG